jgi:hypothetical protein
MENLIVAHTLKVPKIVKLGNVECSDRSISHIETQNGNDPFLFSMLVESDKWCDRLMLFQISRKNLKKFMKFEISLRDIILSNCFAYFIDKTDESIQDTMMLVKVEDIPEDYLPEEVVFFASFKGNPYEEEILNLLK